MGKGKKRRRVTWRVGGLLAHAFVGLSATSACNAWRLTETTRWEREETCRACEIVLDQTW